jgi:ABC-type antimicrobial peptide transport system permease subunit
MSTRTEDTKMRTFLYFLLFLAIAVMVTVLAAILGDEGAWYFAWLIGTTMIVLVSAAGGALLDAQEQQAPEAPAGGAEDPGL